jgi:hypothetical protein
VDNIKMDLREIGWDGMDWIELAQDRDQWRALVRVDDVLEETLVSNDKWKFISLSEQVIKWYMIYLKKTLFCQFIMSSVN